MKLLEELANAVQVQEDEASKKCNILDLEVTCSPPIHTPKPLPLTMKYPFPHYQDVEAVALIQPDIEDGPWIAGGSVINWFRNEPVKSYDAKIAKDIDVFCKNRAQFEEVKLRITEDKRCTIRHNSDNADTFTLVDTDGLYIVVQVIKNRFFDDMDHLLSVFDVRCAKVGTDGKKLYHAPGAVADIVGWRLHLDNPRKDSAFRRALKYMTYGYTPDDEYLRKLLMDPDVQEGAMGDGNYDGIR